MPLDVLDEILAVALAASPWLLLGFLAAGVLRALLPPERLVRWLGGRGTGATLRAAVMGVPLPLCSCGAIPTALALHRSGAGRGPTTAFLISTPGVGVDSLAITHALLGPVMLVARASAALVTAIISGLLVALTGRAEPDRPGPGATTDQCGACGDGCGDSDDGPRARPEGSVAARLVAAIRYAFTTLLDDVSGWLAAGLLVAGVVMAFVPPQALAGIGGGIAPMLLMAVIGIPMYLCATAATPIAAALLATGVSPGTVLVLLVAGPVTSMATLGALHRELGGRALLAYLGGLMTTTVLLGLGLDAVVSGFGLDITAQARSVRDWMPLWVEWGAMILLAALALRPLRRLLGRMGAGRAATAPAEGRRAGGVRR